MIQSGKYVRMQKFQGVYSIPLYSLKSQDKPTGKICDGEVCLVTDCRDHFCQVLTPRGDLGWLDANWLQQA